MLVDQPLIGGELLGNPYSTHHIKIPTDADKAAWIYIQTSTAPNWLRLYVQATCVVTFESGSKKRRHQLITSDPLNRLCLTDVRYWAVSLQ